MKKIALVSPPYHRLVPLTAGLSAKFEPIGLGYIGSMLIQELKVFPKIFSDLPIDIKLAAARLSDYEVIGIGSSTVGIPWTLQLAQELKKANKNTVIILGGDHISACPDVILDPAIDYGIMGEGEVSFTALIKALDMGSGKSLPPHQNISGLVQKKDGCLTQNEIYPYAINLFPWPIRQDLHSYRLPGLTYPAPSMLKAFAQMVFSRGCSRNCVHCATKTMTGKTIKYRDPKDVCAEFEHLICEHDVNLLYLADPNPWQCAEKMEELCFLLKKLRERYVFSWYCAVDPSLNLDQAKILKEAGCFKIALGVETMDNKTLEKIRPWTNTEMISSAINSAVEAGMLVRAYCMMAIPGQTAFEFVKAIEILAHEQIHDLRLSFFTPFPGSGQHTKFQNEGILSPINNYSTIQPILDLKEFPIQLQYEGWQWAMNRFYGSPEFTKREKEAIKKQPDLQQSFVEFRAYLHECKIAL